MVSDALVVVVRRDRWPLAIELLPVSRARYSAHLVHATLDGPSEVKGVNDRDGCVRIGAHFDNSDDPRPGIP